MIAFLPGIPCACCVRHPPHFLGLQPRVGERIIFQCSVSKCNSFPHKVHPSVTIGHQHIVSTRMTLYCAPKQAPWASFLAAESDDRLNTGDSAADSLIRPLLGSFVPCTVIWRRILALSYTSEKLRFACTFVEYSSTLYFSVATQARYASLPTRVSAVADISPSSAEIKKTAPIKWNAAPEESRSSPIK